MDTALAPNNNQATPTDSNWGAVEKEWLDRAENFYLNFNTSEHDLLKYTMDELSDPNITQARTLALQELLMRRSRIVSYMTNTMKIMHDVAMNIIRNLRIS